MATPQLQSDRRFEFDSKACPADTFAVVRLSGFEAISRPYRFELILVSDDARLDLAKVLAADAILRILAPDDDTRATPYAGMLAEFDQLHQAGGLTFYRAVLVPRLWRLSMYRNSEVYLHEQTVVDIVEGILKSARLNPGSDYELKLTGDYRPRSYVCQYQETPFAFVSRWLEREGIYYSFEQVDGRERLVLLDSRLAQPAQAVAVNYRPADELDTGLAPDSVQGFVCRTRPLPRSVVLQDFNHRRASVPLVVQAEVSSAGLGEEMLYGENFRTEEEGQRYARIRAQELLCGERVFNGDATAVGLRSGWFMDLSHHYRDDFNGRYLVTEVRHEGSQAGALLAGLKTPFNDGQQGTNYQASFVALPAQTQYRPERSTPKPRVAGTMSATIDAEGSGDYAELDDHGQYRVQIPFDRTDKGAAKGSAPVRMASPYAGNDHGMHFPLHKGAEVLLSFTDGDPDQPVILGAVPNSQNPNVVDQRNPQDNLISTKGGNQMLMADTRGKEVIWLNSPFHSSSIGIGSVHPDGGGSIFSATKGGSDSVSFGSSNSASFGSTNKLALGTTNSISAAFDNTVSWGTSIGIKASTTVDWKMNAIPTFGLDDDYGVLKNLSLDDSDSVTLSKKSKSNAIEAATISGGNPDGSAAKLRLEAKLKIMRGMIAAYTAVNFAQSTVFGMAVNATDDGSLLGPKQKEDKAKQDAEDLRFAETEAKDKAAEKAALKVPDDIQKDSDAGAKEVADWTAAEEKKIDDKYKDKTSPEDEARKAAEKKALKPPADKAARADKAGAWKRGEEKKIEDKYKNRAAEQAAQSNPGRQSLQGWPGIIGQFGLSAVLNAGALAAMQGVARNLADEIDVLSKQAVSTMTLDTGGISQIVNGDTTPLSGATEQRSEFKMSPTTGVSLLVGSRANWASAALGQRYSEGSILLRSKDVRIDADAQLNLVTPAGDVGHAAANGAFVGLVIAADKAAVGSSQAKVDADGANLKLEGPNISIGFSGPVTSGLAIAAAQKLNALRQGQVLLEASCSQAEAQWDTAQQMAAAVNAPALADDSPLGRALRKASLAAAKGQSLVDDAQDAYNRAVAATAGVSMIHGLTIDNNAAELKYGMAGWKASHSGLAVSFGSTQLSFTAASADITGTLIKLG